VQSDNNIATANDIHGKIRLKITCKSGPCIQFKNHYHTPIYKRSADLYASTHAQMHTHTHTHAHLFVMHLESSLLAGGRIEFT
jgi:hypothetical protein